MRCTRFVGETLIRVLWFFRRVLFLQLLLCTKNMFLATSTLISCSMKAGLALNVFWQGTSKPIRCMSTCCCEMTHRDHYSKSGYWDLVDLSSFMFRHSGLYCAFVWLNLFPGNSVSCCKIICSFLVLC